MTKDQYEQLKPGDKVILNQAGYDYIPKGELVIQSLRAGYIRIETKDGHVRGWHFNIFDVVKPDTSGWNTP